MNRSQPSLGLPLPPVGVDSTLVATPVPPTNPHHQQWQETYRGRELKLVWYWLSIYTAGRQAGTGRKLGDGRTPGKMSGAALPHGAMRGVGTL